MTISQDISVMHKDAQLCSPCVTYYICYINEVLTFVLAHDTVAWFEYIRVDDHSSRHLSDVT